MSKDIVKTSKIIKGMTTNVRSHFDIFDRARDVYLEQIKRAEANYFERIRRATAILTGQPEPAKETDETRPAA